MIGDTDTVILEVLQKGLSGLLPRDTVAVGEPDAKKPKFLSIVCTSFSAGEEGIGGSGGVKREAVTDDFPADGKTAEFTLSQKAVRPLLSVETPVGTARSTPDDYTVDYERGVLTFRVVPEKKTKVRVNYSVDRAVGETRTIRFFLTYHLAIGAATREECDAIILETIRVLSRERPRLEKGGVTELRLVRGFARMYPENKDRTVDVLEYEAQTTIQIEIPVPPIERITIANL